MFWKRKPEDRCQALINSLIEGDIIKLRRLLEDGAEANCKDKLETPALIIAASRHENEGVKMLLAHGADPRTTGKHGLSAVGLAKQNNRRETLELLQS